MARIQKQNQQTQQLDPLAAMIAESIASQFMPVPPAPLTVPQQSNTQKVLRFSIKTVVFCME
jgi:hypothetical protein